VRHKIFNDPETLVPHLDELRERGAVIVTANGCFELLHIGHVRYLAAAKRQGDVLVLMMNTDASLKRIKPDRQPENTDQDRFEILAALECVDYVVPLDEDTPTRLLGLFRPHVHTKGTDYSLDEIPERELVIRDK
jgi:rfaE bifunctional protein nucleotidyltransferase chain/domain